MKKGVNYGIGEKALLYKVYQLNDRDVDQLVRLSQRIGWDYDPAEVGTVLASGNILGHKNGRGELLSSAAIISYTNWASLGMVIVSPDYQGIGLGKEITSACVDLVPESTPIMLISTDEGKPLYKRLGFRTLSHVYKCLCQTPLTHQPDPLPGDLQMTTVTPEEIAKISLLDQGATGGDRKQFLTIRLQQATKKIAIRDYDGRMVGFGFSVQTPENLILGPIVAPDDKVATALVYKLAEQHQGTLRIDIPYGKESFLSRLEQAGFRKVRQPPVMVANSTRIPKRNGTLYGIAAQVFG